MVENTDRADAAWPIVDGKDHDGASVFKPEALLREARRQRRLQTVAVPEICLLDPDGGVVRYLKRTGAGRLHGGWACYHTELLAFELDGVGEIGSSVAPSALRLPCWSPSSFSRPVAGCSSASHRQVR
jgi:hypothetical protein